MGIAAPALGAVAAHTGMSAVFFVSAFVVLGAVPVALPMLNRHVPS